MDFFHWRKHYYELWTRIFAKSNNLKLKHPNNGFVSNKHAAFGFSSHYLMDWSGVNYL